MTTTTKTTTLSVVIIAATDSTPFPPIYSVKRINEDLKTTTMSQIKKTFKQRERSLHPYCLFTALPFVFVPDLMTAVLSSHHLSGFDVWVHGQEETNGVEKSFHFVEFGNVL